MKAVEGLGAIQNTAANTAAMLDTFFFSKFFFHEKVDVGYTLKLAS